MRAREHRSGWIVTWVFLLAALASPLLAQGPAQATWGALDLGPLRAARAGYPEVVPVAAGDVVLVSDSFRVLALDAASGAQRWTGAPEGWEALPEAQRRSLERACDATRLLVAPAVEGDVVVAALQLAFSRTVDDDWQGIPISSALPERRLFAFDRASGRPLWNHAPPPGQDVAAGTFAQRMRVCGMPLVAGGRVLVPCTYDESSIDLHVLCCALDSGQELWHTFVQRGQVERCVFGDAQAREFVTAPLVASPDDTRVVAQTGLGNVAALDLRDGSLLWSTVVPTIPLTRPRSYPPPRRALVWRTTPPVVADGSVYATPGDGNALVALDLESGVIRWALPATGLQALLASKDLVLDHLVGARDGLVVLAGRGCAVALALEEDDARPPHVSWVFKGNASREGTARARLAGERVLLPDADGVRELELRTGAELFRHEALKVCGIDASGSFALTPMALVALTR